ncbi:hypothetical protein LO767_03350 [Halopseudomonas aestusnigri]|uniref:hypothetical protein n=1 Tax=Halopseudomonas aestusnigri TaxID=857252 RepID=UPI001E33D3D1|nr:hypothetical protein [Halopseudomonas aestusnigri]UGV31556.1 hypothetical protein LO767_03350 [Halopseudomonas aestusnigri]
MIPEVEKAKAVMEAAQKNLSKLTEAAYPRGTVVVCRLAGYIVELEVCRRRGSDWASPGQMVGRNTKTGKYRTFTDADVVRVVSYFTPPSLSDVWYDIGLEEINQVAWMDQHGRLHTDTNNGLEEVHQELASVTAERDQALQLLYESRHCRRAAPYDFTDLLQRMDQVLAGYQPGVAHG